jgi:hypothetical protein
MSGKPPLYARVLRLHYIRPGGLLCFAFFEGAVAVGILLALAELAPWWAALVLPVAVALMVKINDIVAGLNARARLVPAHTRSGTARRAAVPRAAVPRAAVPRAAVPRARPADTPPPTSKVRARGRATAPGALSAAELPDPGNGTGPSEPRPTPTGHIYRHVPDDADDAGRTTETDGSGEYRRTLNQRRFDLPT